MRDSLKKMKKLKDKINEYRKELSTDIQALLVKQYDGTANEFDLEQLYTLQGEYQSIMDNPDNFEIA